MGTLVAFITMMLSLVWPIASLGFLLSMTQESFTAANRIAEIFDAPREITDGPQTGRAARRPAGTRSTSASGSPTAGPDDWALRHVTVTVEPGETLALVGSTGSGKSVLASLLSRLYDVTEGEIRIDGQDIRELSLPALRQAVATAFEDPTLFSMSVAENLRLGRPEATDEQLAQAIDVAAAQFVYDLPFGLDTRIGEQGMSLSGGQRQRLSLARAILAAPKILVLDDTLSALDVHTEAVVEEALRPRAACGHRHRRRAPGVDGAARRQGGAARSAAPSPTSAPTPNCWPACRSTAICWPPTTNSTTVPSAPARGRTTRTATGSGLATRSRRPPKMPATHASCRRR